MITLPVLSPDRIPFLWGLGLEPAPRLKVGGPRWQQLTSTEKLLLSMSEDDWAAFVLEYADVRGWTYWHDRDSRLNDAGFPDYMFTRDRLVWAELKNETYKASDAQLAFAGRLRRAGQEVHLWRPRHRQLVLEVLR